MSINYIALLKSKSIIEYFQKENILLIKNGKNYSACCPIHQEKTPSFYVSEEKNKWNCYGECKSNGDIIDFVCKYRNLEKSEAINYLCRLYNIEKKNNKENSKTNKSQQLINICNITAQFYNELISKYKIGRKYFLERIDSPDLINEFCIGYAPDTSESGNWYLLRDHLLSKGIDFSLAEQIGILRKNDKGTYYDSYRGRLILPIHSVTGDCIGFNTRILPCYQKDLPKYLVSNETEIFKKSNVVYGYHITAKYINNEGIANHVEGVFDFLNYYRYGYKNTIPHMGNPSFIPKVNTHCIIMDPDKAGKKYSLEFAEKILKLEKTPIIYSIKDKDPSDLNKNEIEELMACERDYIDIYLESVYKYKNSIEHKMNVLDGISKELNGVKNEILMLYANKISKQLEIPYKVVLFRMGLENKLKYKEIYEELKFL